MGKIRFLTLAEVLEVHLDQMERYGGEAGIRDSGLLLSALSMPGAKFAGTRLHRDLFDIAAAYAFHIGKNHPFADGNKRTALASALTFLAVNGVSLDDPEGLLHNAMIGMITGHVDKKALASVFRDLAHLK
jgi:death-on-curing protein